MSYFAVVLSRTDNSWAAEELDLDDVDDFDGLVEAALAQTTERFDAGLVAVEEDDEWLALVRIDGEGDPRVFLSDTRPLATSRIAGLFADALEGDTDLDESDDDEDDEDEEDGDGAAAGIDATPGGDPGLVADLGTSAAQLLALCAKEGELPGDITAAVCERAGCLDVYDSLRVT